MFGISYIWIVCAALVALVLVSQLQLANEKRAHADTKTGYGLLVTRAEVARTAASELTRLREKELLDVQEAHAAEFRLLETKHMVAMQRADVAAISLRSASAALAASARQRCNAPAPADAGTSTYDPIGVFAHVLGLADDAAGRMATIAHSRGVAGAACERTYDATRETVNKEN